MELRVRALDADALDAAVALLALPGCAAGTLGRLAVRGGRLVDAYAMSRLRPA